MSYIDSWNNSYVGNFANLPIYHPLQDIDPEGKDEFTATPKNLVLGGGSGEHPGMVVKDLDFCVWKFLESLADIANKEAYEIDFYTNYLDSAPNQMYSEYDVYTNLHFAHWDLNAIAKFSNNVDTTFSDSTKYFKHKENFEKISVEEKIHIMLGEFIFFSAKKLISEPVREYIDKNIHLLEKHNIDVSAPFIAVNVLPKGYPLYSGRCIVDNGNGTDSVKWGLRFDEEHLIDPLLNSPDRLNRSKKLKF